MKVKMKQQQKQRARKMGARRTTAEEGVDSTTDRRREFSNIIKDIQSLVDSHSTWKDRKETENQRIISLGGKPIKKQRLPLSVARVQMKKQKEREQKLMEQRALLQQSGLRVPDGPGGGSGARKSADDRRPEKRVLRSTEGYFKNGVLDVKHLLRKTPTQEKDSTPFQRKGKGSRLHGFDENRKEGGGKKKGGGKKNKGKKKGGGKKRH